MKLAKDLSLATIVFAVMALIGLFMADIVDFLITQLGIQNEYFVIVIFCIVLMPMVVATPVIYKFFKSQKILKTKEEIYKCFKIDTTGQFSYKVCKNCAYRFGKRCSLKKNLLIEKEYSCEKFTGIFHEQKGWL